MSEQRLTVAEAAARLEVTIGRVKRILARSPERFPGCELVRFGKRSRWEIPAKAVDDFLRLPCGNRTDRRYRGGRKPGVRPRVKAVAE
jgi:hypothetical protein